MRAAVILVAVLAVGCAANAPEDQAKFPCDKFRDLSSDIGQGTVTAAEKRQRLQEIDTQAPAATPAVASAATAMLAASTTGTEADLTAAMFKMDAACEATGN